MKDFNDLLKTSDSATTCAGGAGEADTDKHAVAIRVQRMAMHTSCTWPSVREVLRTAMLFLIMQ